MREREILVVYGNRDTATFPGDIFRLLPPEEYNGDLPGELLNLPREPELIEDFLFARLRELAAPHHQLTVQLDGMPVDLALAVTNAMTLCGRIHDSLELNGRSIPFSRLSYLAETPGLILPDSMHERFDRINCELIKNTVTPEVYLNPDSRVCQIDRTYINLDDMEMVAYWMLLRRADNQLPPLRGIDVLTEEFNAFLVSTLACVMPGVERLTAVKSGVLAEIIDSIAKKITAEVAFADGCFFCLPQPMPEVFGVMLYPARIHCPRNY